MELVKVDPVNEHQQEALDILQEECGELVQAISKIRRGGLGWTSDLAYDPEQITFKQHLITELGDVQALIREVVAAGVVTQQEIDQASYTKAAKLVRWTKFLGIRRNRK